VLLRLPVIPGITDTNENIEGLVEFASSLKDIRQIELLPFHDVSEKYARLSREYKMLDYSAPPPATMRRIREAFEKIGFSVKS
jgi:pyruvate formate lyase activating enzyme